MRHVGVDLSRNSFTACFLDQDDSYHIASFPLSEEGLSAFRRQLSSADRLAVEAGPSAYFFNDQGFEVITHLGASLIGIDRQASFQDVEPCEWLLP